jgi:predicted RNA methylase
VLCGDSIRPEDVSRLLGERQPVLMVTDPPYGIEFNSEWRDRAGLNTALGQSRRWPEACPGEGSTAISELHEAGPGQSTGASLV